MIPRISRVLNGTKLLRNEKWWIKLSTKIACPLPKDYRDLIHQFSGSGSGTRSRLASKAEESPNDDAILPDHQLVQGLENLLTANIPYYDIPIPLTTSVRPPPATLAVTRRSTSTTQRQATTRSGHYLHFFLFPFCKKSMTPHRGNTILFHSSK